MKRTITTIFLAVFMWAVSHVAVAAKSSELRQKRRPWSRRPWPIKTSGKDKVFAEINNPKGKFTDRDLYIFVYDMNGKCVAHGFNQKMIGKDLVDMKDPDGKFYVKERIEISKTKGKGWQDYKFTNPLTKKLENKTAYVEKLDDLIVGSGAYKEVTD